jgi:hypothetical protein
MPPVVNPSATTAMPSVKRVSRDQPIIATLLVIAAAQIRL